jgi:isocitrate dehydrogenase
MIMATTHFPVTVAYGDGIGPEIMEAVLRILRYAEAPLTIETVEVGEKLYTRGYASGIGPETWDSLKRTRLLLKGPITTPQGKGYKSLNVTLRKALGLYANIRPCVAYPPYIPTHFPTMNLVIVRENEEDLYAGIEHRSTRNMYQTLKLVSTTGSEKIIRYAFEYALQAGRKKVTCLSKDNIMKMTDGTFHRAFDRIAKEYPSITADHLIIDIGSARLATVPERFDVIVTSNLYGDIVSDITAEISGSVGMAGSANIGSEAAMFEAIHGSAPDISGQDIANPSGLLQAAVMLLVHLGLIDVANKIQNAWAATLEAGLHTADIYSEEHSTKKLGTQAFADAVIDHFGRKPKYLPAAAFRAAEKKSGTSAPGPLLPVGEKKQLVGVDIFVDWTGSSLETLAHFFDHSVEKVGLGLQSISCLGLVVWPKQLGRLPTSDHWCLRFFPPQSDGQSLKQTTHQAVIQLLLLCVDQGLDVVKTEMLYCYDGSLGFSLFQGD